MQKISSFVAEDIVDDVYLVARKLLISSDPSTLTFNSYFLILKQ